MAHLIHGLFVQKASVANTHLMFAGTIWRSPTPEIRTGQMQDGWGLSTLSNIEFPAPPQTRFQFTKRYEGRPDDIYYSFDLRDGIWVGGYSGKDVGKGESWCVLTEVKDELIFDPNYLEALFKGK